jgi:Holliday junction resolvase-like predicted endonuclease
MTTGRQNKLVGQTGEYLVAAELSRRGLIATTFTGNVPHYDIVASDEKGRHVSVQVKTIRGHSWQIGDITQFCNIVFKGKRQIVKRAKLCPVKRLICVMVKLGDDGQDNFYILPWVKLRDKLVKGHKAYLSKHKGIRPKRWDSFHTVISEKKLSPFKDRWDFIEESLQ